MKIHSGDPLSGFPRVQPKAADEPKSPAFSDVLEKTFASKPPVQVSAACPAAAVMHPMAVDLTELHSNTERFLDAMERYQSLLGDERVSLREVEPALNELRKAVDRLGPMSEAMTVDHPAWQIARGVVLTAAKEIARFERGDYVPD
jgi:hypothetical protein